MKEPIPVHYDLVGNVDRYGSAGSAIVVPLVLVPCILILLAATHIFPLSMWSLPVKPKPGREVCIYRDTAHLVTLYTLQSGVYSLASTMCVALGKATLVGTMSMVLCIAMVLTAVIIIVKCVVENR